MRFRLSMLLLLVALLTGGATSAEAQVRGIVSGGTSSGSGGRLDITIETFGTLISINSCPAERYTFSIPIPQGATCQIMTQAIYDELSAALVGIFDVTLSLPLCTVYLRREKPDPGCNYFEAKVDGDWQGMTFDVVDDPTPIEATNWGLLKLSGWRSALRGEARTPRH